MERNQMRSGSLVELEFVTAGSALRHRHDYIELMYIVSGKADVLSGKDSCTLSAKDILVINARREHSYRAHPGFLMARLLISEA